MNRNGLLANIGFALLMSGLGCGLFYLAATWLLSWMALLAVLVVLAGCYLVWLLYCHGSRRGIAWVVLSWSAVTLLLLLLGGGALAAALAFTMVVWLTRSGLRYSQGPYRVVKALLDGGTSLAALMLSLWVAQQTHSLALTLWTYFFIQALLFLVPAAGSPGHGAQAVNRFDLARGNAELALRQLQSRHS
ncbi:hypothetical protein [Ketobacter sp.]|uniref:hypothetical protein n=1 Tax=Ketobacter sp. TaxID=2083498 RepID=UPI000F1F3456|nr:hypothetical protein [Ketobacter sp.]RLU00658.1 MAG: hypothetical protein D9N14_05155 [Ketobacter sp.]